MKKSILTLMLLMVTMIAMAGDKNTKKVVFTTTPVMHCENCENKIKNNLRFVKGVTDIETSVPDQAVTVTYNPDKTSVEKIQKGFKKIGYEAKVVEGKAAKAGCCGGKGCAKGEMKNCAKGKMKDCKKADAKACAGEMKDCAKAEKKADCCKK